MQLALSKTYKDVICSMWCYITGHKLIKHDLAKMLDHSADFELIIILFQHKYHNFILAWYSIYYVILTHRRLC